VTTTFVVSCDCGCGKHWTDLDYPIPAHWWALEQADGNNHLDGQPLLFAGMDCVTRYALRQEHPEPINMPPNLEGLEDS
jgi:hypothetical protein